VLGGGPANETGVWKVSKSVTRVKQMARGGNWVGKTPGGGKKKRVYRTNLGSDGGGLGRIDNSVALNGTGKEGNGKAKARLWKLKEKS